MALLLQKTFTVLRIRFAFPEKFKKKPEKCATLVLTFVTYIKEDQGHIRFQIKFAVLENSFNKTSRFLRSS